MDASNLALTSVARFAGSYVLGLVLPGLTPGATSMPPASQARWAFSIQIDVCEGQAPWPRGKERC